MNVEKLEKNARRGEEHNDSSVKITGSAEQYIKLAIAKRYHRKSPSELEETSHRDLEYSPIYANHGKLTGIAFSLAGSPPRGTIFAATYFSLHDALSEERNFRWHIVNIVNVRVIKDAELAKAINAFTIEKNIPLEKPDPELDRLIEGMIRREPA